jgi:hypothetical protein
MMQHSLFDLIYKNMIRFIKWLFGWGQEKTIDKKVCKELVCFV